MDIGIDCLLIGAIAFITALAITPLAKQIAWKLGAIDYPSGRRVNKTAVPRLGGVAVIGGAAIGMLFMVFLVSMGAWETPFSAHPVLQIDWTIAGLGVAFMFAVGMVDDFYGLSPMLKLVGQIVSASIVAASGVLLVSIGNPFASETISLGWAAYPITVFYLVAFANVMNLIDGLDGLCSSITIVSTVSIMVFAFAAGRADVLLIGSAIIGACLAFLKFNHHPASIFLGDCGSLTLGLLLGIISLVAIARSTLLASMLVPLLAAGVPIIDTASAIIRRKRGHLSVGQADRGHIHHKLLDAGYSQTKTVCIMVAWTILLSAGGIAVTFIRAWPRYVILAVLIIISLVIICKLGILKPILIHSYDPRMSKRHVQDGTFDEEELKEARKHAMTRDGGAAPLEQEKSSRE